MRHRKFGKHLGRSVGQRNALRRTLITQLFAYERIKTTQTKAQAIRGAAEHMITMAKRSLVHPDPMRKVHIRRILNGRLDSPDVVDKVITELAPRYSERPGGYTRIYKLGPRKGDSAEMVLIELVDRPTDSEVSTGAAGAVQNVTGRARGLLNRLRGRGQQAGTSGTAASASSEATSSRDKLTRIEGIGPKVQQALYDAGITTFEQVANTSGEELTRIVKEEKKVNMVGDATTWPKQAKLIVDGDEAGLKEYQDRLVGGREPGE
ncbi:MAG: 50S ribosomal protein L17 [Anaerolineae bacterium]|nr:50S ribosomal protein L17 [Anaerolineae bacterium]